MFNDILDSLFVHQALTDLRKYLTLAVAIAIIVYPTNNATQYIWHCERIWLCAI